jgi:flagellar biosynthesis chaperone FliJ
MPNYKSVTVYNQIKSRSKAVQEAQEKIPEAQANVIRLRQRHSKLCELFGDSGVVRQELENAENYLEQLKETMRQQAAQ